MTDQPSAGTSQPAGFYPDSTGTMRFWDGSQWTDHTQAPAAPVKKKHTVRNVLIGIFVLIALTFVGCTALVGSAVNEAGKAIDEEVTQQQEEDDAPGGPNNPLEITEGEAFTVLGFDYAAGWSIEESEFGGFDFIDLKVTNNRDEADSLLSEIRFMQGTEVLAVANCSTEEIAVGNTTTVDCGSLDDLPADYDAITISDSF